MVGNRRTRWATTFYRSIDLSPVDVYVKPELGIGWIPSSSPTINRLRNIVPAGAVVVPCVDEVELLMAVSSGRVALTVIEAAGGSNAAALLALRRLREEFPRHPVVAWCDVRAITPHDLLAIARAGVQDLIRHDLDELRHVFVRIVASATQRAISYRILEEISDVVQQRLHPLLEYVLEHSHEHLDRDGVAAVFGLSRRTLQNRLTEARLPPLRPFLTWCRLLVATALLDEPGHTLDSVAAQLDFHDGANLGVALRRYTGTNITQLRARGAFTEAVRAFRHAVVANPSYEASLPQSSSAD